MFVPDHLAKYDVRAAVDQLPDGTTRAPLIHVGQYDYSASDARLIARALLDAADAGDQMATPVANHSKQIHE